jgi:hypothetical protein
MKHHTRRSVAYIVGRAISGKTSSSLYDYSTSKYYPFSGSVDNHSVSIYDYTQKCFVSGSISSVYHYGNSKHVSLKVSGDTFSGYDYDEGKNFSGTVNGGSISFYDYGTSSYFNYSL